MTYEKGKTYQVTAPTRALRQHYAALAKVSGCQFEYAAAQDPSPRPEHQTAPCGATNINTATADGLIELSGVGPARAQRIIDNRPYGCVDDLLTVPGTKEHVWRAVIDENELTA